MSDPTEAHGAASATVSDQTQGTTSNETPVFQLTYIQHESVGGTRHTIQPDQELYQTMSRVLQIALGILKTPKGLEALSNMVKDCEYYLIWTVKELGTDYDGFLFPEAELEELAKADATDFLKNLSQRIPPIIVTKIGHHRIFMRGTPTILGSVTIGPILIGLQKAESTFPPR